MAQAWRRSWVRIGRTPAFVVASASAHQSAHAVGEVLLLVVKTSSSG